MSKRKKGIKQSDSELISSANTPLLKKKGKVLATLSLIFSIASIPCLFTGLIPFQIVFLIAALIFHAIDRKVNGKRGVSVFSMVCTIVTFIMIFSTLTYCTILFAFGMYTAFVNPEPYNAIMGALKSALDSVLGIFGVTL